MRAIPKWRLRPSTARCENSARRTCTWQTNGKTVLRFRLLAKTQFRDKQNEPIRDSLLHPGDQLSVLVNPDDPETAIRIVFVREGSAAEKKSADKTLDEARAPEAKDLPKTRTTIAQESAPLPLSDPTPPPHPVNGRRAGEVIARRAREPRRPRRRSVRRAALE